MEAEGCQGVLYDHARRVWNEFDGYVPLLFTDGPPPPARLPNGHLVLQHRELCKERIRYHLQLGALERTDWSEADPKWVHPLHIVIKPRSKPRLCIDLSRNLNDYLEAAPFQYETVWSAVDQCIEAGTGCFLAKCDVEAAFMSFPVRPADRALMRFQFEGELYTPTTLPFGMSSSPLYCSALMFVVRHAVLSEFAKLERAAAEAAAADPSAPDTHHRLFLTLYLDDWLVCGPTREACEAGLSTVIRVLAQFGLSVKSSKTAHASTRCEFLGILFDTLAGTVQITPERLAELDTLLEEWLGRATATGRDAKRLAGKLAFCAAVLPSSRPFCAALFEFAAHMPAHGHHKRRVSAALRGDLAVWRARLSTWNGRQRWCPSVTELVLCTDASVEGFGGWIVWASPRVQAGLATLGIAVGACFQGEWAPEHRQFIASHRDIAWGELFACAWLFHQVSAAAADATVLFKLDNRGDTYAIARQRVRAPNTALRALMRHLFTDLFEVNANPRAEHVAGVNNDLSDLLSRPSRHKHALTLASLRAKFPAHAISSLQCVLSSTSLRPERGNSPESWCKRS